MFDEGQPSGFKLVKRYLIEIVYVDFQPGFREGQHQRNADVACAADNGNIGVLGG